MNTDALRVAAVSVAYRRNTVLDDVTGSVPRGSTVVLVGANGAGKSTFVRTVAGLLLPDSGAVEYPVDPGRAPATRGFLFEEPNLYPHLSGRTNLRILAPEARANVARLEQTCETLGIDSALLRRRARGYSFGQRRKVTLAGLFGQPRDVMVLDEPTNGLDPDAIDGFLELVRSARGEGRTMLITGQDHVAFGALADEVWMLDGSHLTIIGDWQSLTTSPTVLEVTSADPESLLVWMGATVPDLPVRRRGETITVEGAEDGLRRLAATLLANDTRRLVSSCAVRATSLADLVRAATRIPEER